MKYALKKNSYWGLGLGIGDWAQSPIPNPQSPNYFLKKYIILIKKIIINYKIKEIIKNYIL